MKKLLILFLSLSLLTSVSEARSKRKSRSIKFGTASRTAAKKHRTTKRKKRYSFTYDQIWFASLTSRQQIVYLKTLSRLARQISRVNGKYAFNDLLMNSFFPPVFADSSGNICSEENIEKNIEKCVISNGYMRPRKKDGFNLFFNEKNDITGFQSLLPKRRPGGQLGCPEGQQPCAPYLGLDGNGKLTCSGDRTDLCGGGDAISNLQKELISCQDKTDTYCSNLRQEMDTSTKGVETWCNTENQKNKRWCVAAMQALEKAKISPAPVETDPFQRGNCKRLADEMVRLKEKNRNSSQAAKAAYNNQFWNDMAFVARNLCSRSFDETSRVMGVCDVSPKAVNEKVYSEEDGKKYSNCKTAKLEKEERECDKNEKKIKAEYEDVSEQIVNGINIELGKEERKLIEEQDENKISDLRRKWVDKSSRLKEEKKKLETLQARCETEKEKIKTADTCKQEVSAGSEDYISVANLNREEFKKRSARIEKKILKM